MAKIHRLRSKPFCGVISPYPIVAMMVMLKYRDCKHRQLSIPVQSYSTLQHIEGVAAEAPPHVRMRCSGSDSTEVLWEQVNS